VISTLILLALAPTTHTVWKAERPTAVIGQCDPEGRPREVIWHRETRKEVRKRVKDACEHAKAAPIVCAFADAVVMRESAGRAGVRHTLGHREVGLGAMGLSTRWQASRWPGDADPDFCVPEVSFAVAHAIMWSAWRKYRARNILELQSVFGSGGGHCVDGKCRPDVQGRHVKSICGRMKRRGFDCTTKLHAKDLGEWIPKAERQSWVAELVP
jgi:hypothetical protein